MLFENLLLPGVVIPSLVAAAVFLLGSLMIRKGLLGPADAKGAASLALAAAFLSAFVAMTGWPRLPPVGSSQHLFFLVALAGIVGWIAGLRRRKSLPWWGRGMLCALLLGLMLQAKVSHTWSTVQSALWLGGLLALGLTLFWALETHLRNQRDDGSLRSAWVRLTLLAGTALILGLSESARLAQLAGALACGVLAVEILARLRGLRPWRGVDGTVLSTAIFGLMLSGYFYASLATWPALLLVTAYLLLALPAARGAWIAPLLPLALAFGLVLAAFLMKEDDPYDYYGSLNGSLNGAATITCRSFEVG